MSDVVIDHARMGLFVANAGDSVFENISMDRCASAGELKMCENVKFRNGRYNGRPLDIGMFDAKGLRAVTFGGTGL